MNVNTNTMSDHLVTGSRKTKPIIRGVSCELASWTATSKAEETNTMKVNMDDAKVPKTDWAVSGLTPCCHPIMTSSQRQKRAATIATAILTTGHTQSEFVT